MKRLVFWILCLFAALLIACGEGEVGDPCDEAGSEDECVDGAICTNEAGGDNVCREICEDQDDCPAGYSCNGIEGSNKKSCQPD